MSALDAIPDLQPDTSTSPDDVTALAHDALPSAPATTSPLGSLRALFAPSDPSASAGLTPPPSAPIPNAPTSIAGSPSAPVAPLASLPMLPSGPAPQPASVSPQPAGADAPPHASFLQQLPDLLQALVPAIATVSMARSNNPYLLPMGTSALLAGIMQGRLAKEKQLAAQQAQAIHYAQIVGDISHQEAADRLAALREQQSGQQFIYGQVSNAKKAVDDYVQQHPGDVAGAAAFAASWDKLLTQAFGTPTGTITATVPKSGSAKAIQAAAQAQWTKIAELYKNNLDDPQFLDGDVPVSADLAPLLGLQPGDQIPIRQLQSLAGLSVSKGAQPVTPKTSDPLVPVKQYDPKTGRTTTTYMTRQEAEGKSFLQPPPAAIQVQTGSTVKDITPGTPEFRVAQDLAYGKLTFPQFRTLYAYSRDASARTAIYLKASELNPGFNPAQFEMGFTLAKNPRVQQQLASMDNVQQMVPEILQMSDAAARSGVPALNRFVVTGGLELGGRHYSDFKAAQTAFADELSGALGFGSATDMSRAMGYDLTNTSLSPQQFTSAIQNVVVPFLARKRQTLLDQMNVYGQPGMNPAAGPLPAPPPGAPSAGGRVRVVGPNGESGTILKGDTLPPGWKVVP